MAPFVNIAELSDEQLESMVDLTRKEGGDTYRAHQVAVLELRMARPVGFVYWEIGDDMYKCSPDDPNRPPRIEWVNGSIANEIGISRWHGAPLIKALLYRYLRPQMLRIFHSDPRHLRA